MTKGLPSVCTHGEDVTRESLRMGDTMKDQHVLRNGHVISPRLSGSSATSSYQWRIVDLPRHLTRHEASRMLAEQAEYGAWELARSVIFVGGGRRVWLRRRTLRVERTDA